MNPYFCHGYPFADDETAHNTLFVPFKHRLVDNFQNLLIARYRTATLPALSGPRSAPPSLHIIHSYRMYDSYDNEGCRHILTYSSAVPDAHGDVRMAITQTDNRDTQADWWQDLPLEGDHHYTEEIWSRLEQLDALTESSTVKKYQKVYKQAELFV